MTPIQKADKWFSIWRRMEDADENGICHCFTCGHMSEPKYIQCGHYVERQHKQTRFSEKNTRSQCGGCNKFGQGKAVIFRRKLVEIYGENEVLLLESAKHKTFHLGKFELDQIAKFYKQKATELSRAKSIPLW
jgi:hypothetical protein